MHFHTESRKECGKMENVLDEEKNPFATEPVGRLIAKLRSHV